MDCGHTKCLSWNIKYFLSYWVISTLITACLCVLQTRSKHTSEKQETSSLLGAQVFCQLEWLQLCCCWRRVTSGQPQAKCSLASRLGFGWDSLHSSSVSVPVCTCEFTPLWGDFPVPQVLCGCLCCPQGTDWVRIWGHWHCDKKRTLGNVI